MRTKNRYYFILFHILFLFIIGLKNSVWVMIRDSSFPFTEEEKKNPVVSGWDYWETKTRTFTR